MAYSMEEILALTGKGTKKEEDKILVIVVGDYNDGDYVTTEKFITKEELDRLRPIVELISKCPDRHNWPEYDYSSEDISDLFYNGLISEDDAEWFSDVFVPQAEDCIHTIVSVTIHYVSKTELMY